MILGLLGASLLFYLIVWELPFLFVSKDRIMNNLNCEDEKRVLDESINGIVTAKFRDKENHMVETIEYRNEAGSHKSLLFMNDRSGAYDFVILGDSLLKNPKSLDVKIVRDSSEANYRLDFGCIQNEKQGPRE